MCIRRFLRQLSLINDPVIISRQSTKVYVFSDAVLCLGKVLQHRECNEAWKNRVAGVRAERSYRDYDAINGESTEFEWNIFPGFTTLQLCDKISDLLSSMGHVKGMYPAPDIHEHFTIHKWLRQTAYIFTHNFNNLEHTATNCMSTMTHTDVTTAYH